MQAHKAYRLLVVLLLASAALLAVGVCIGSMGFAGAVQAFQAIATPNDANQISQQIVWDIRLPRTLGAWLAGALLGLTGALAQGLFRNPLADPYLLGSASGAALGVALALLASSTSALSMGWALRLGMTGAAFVGAVLAVLLTMLLARGVGHTLRLLLAGVVVGVVLGAVTSMITLVEPSLLQAMQSFTLGTTAFVGWQACALMAGALLLCLIAALSGARLLDGLSLGEQVVQSLGFRLNRLRFGLVLVLALATGTAVAQTGLIAFVGLAAPHAVRALVRVPHRYVLILSTAMGAVLLTAADVLARGLLAPQELPVGVVTAILGGGYLLYLMYRQQSAASDGDAGRSGNQLGGRLS